MDGGNVLKVLLLFCMCSLVYGKTADKPIELSEDNWRDILEGEWMVEFMAPWCPACRSFKDTWASFAKWSKDLDVNIGIIDVTENPGLSGRFFVTALPTLYHVRDGVFRQYHGARKESDLISFIDDNKWRDIEPVSGWFAPNSIQMSTVGLFFKAAMVIRSFYTTMTSEYGIPEWGCYLIFAVLTIITGLLLGLLIVCCCDILFPPKYQSVRVVQQHPPEMEDTPDREDKDDDIIDDTKQTLDDDDDKDDETTTRRRRVEKAE
ncbi:thioredoxin-related transmembrane protein 1-like [Haliotis asinina]|uniref:thioredoxin-related transmembrane protein 1-like n=1 Tax=Haliotis asinina TaxID=109174 RepID=UPI0035319BEF